MRRLFLIVFTAAAMLGAGATASLGSHSTPDHWRDNDPGYPRGYVYWVDNTGSEWPVYSAAIDWDQAPRLDAVYVTNEANCPSHCVSVNEADLDAGCTGRLGVATTYTNASGHLTGQTYVRIDRQCDNRNYADRRELVCHEMGHTLRLQHVDPSLPTCMRQGDMIGEQDPRQHDYDALHNMYDHNDPG